MTANVALVHFAHFVLRVVLFISFISLHKGKVHRMLLLLTSLSCFYCLMVQFDCTILTLSSCTVYFYFVAMEFTVGINNLC